MRVFKSLSEWRMFRRVDLRDHSLGFVPTMGALHAGHISLVERSRSENSKTVVSIFINPTQFDEKNDLERYPRTLDQDLAMLSQNLCDFVLCPTTDEMYPDDFKYRIDETELSQKLCGESRPGHFRGMLTVVMKLLSLTKADRAYFGEKDFQQLLLVEKMAEAFFLDTQIIPCPIVREDDGLAMSSRNKRLSPSERLVAPHFSEILSTSQSAEEAKRLLLAAGFGVDYVKDDFGRRLGAIRLGETRLIDNVFLS